MTFYVDLNEVDSPFILQQFINWKSLHIVGICTINGVDKSRAGMAAELKQRDKDQQKGTSKVH